MTSIQEDRDFLSAQHKTRHRGKMGNVDKVLTKREENLRRREDCQKKSQKRKKEKNLFKENITLLASLSFEKEIDTQTVTSKLTKKSGCCCECKRQTNDSKIKKS